jgi:acetyltransferase
VSSDTPIVVVKSGRTEAGASAAASHTGAIAGSEAAYEAALDQAGVLRVETVQELFDFGSILAGQPLPEQDEVAIVTNAGGPGVMTTDAVGDSNLSLASFTDETVDAFRDARPEEANVYNPVDIIGDAPVDRFEAALDIALADPNVGGAVVLACPTATLSYEALADAVVDRQAEYEMPVAATLMGGSSTRSAADTLSAAGIPTYFDPARAVRSLDALREYRDISRKEYAEPETFDVDRGAAREVLESADRRDRNRLGVEAMGLLDAYGIPTPDSEIVDSRSDAVDAGRRLVGERSGDSETETESENDSEVVMKIVSPDILHKSDIGGSQSASRPRKLATRTRTS